jgi:hypothetical protein
MPNCCPQPQNMIWLLDKDAITKKGSLVNVERYDFLLKHSNKELTTKFNSKILEMV